jgi:RES domain-containing protein
MSLTGELPLYAKVESREIGTAWLRKNEAVLLEIPSAIVPHTRNYLFNRCLGNSARNQTF